MDGYYQKTDMILTGLMGTNCHILSVIRQKMKQVSFCKNLLYIPVTYEFKLFVLTEGSPKEDDDENLDFSYQHWLDDELLNDDDNED